MAVAEHAEEVRRAPATPGPGAAAGRAAACSPSVAVAPTNGVVKLKPEEVAALAFARAAGVHEPHEPKAAPGARSPPLAAAAHRAEPPPPPAPSRRRGRARRPPRPLNGGGTATRAPSRAGDARRAPRRGPAAAAAAAAPRRRRRAAAPAPRRRAARAQASRAVILTAVVGVLVLGGAVFFTSSRRRRRRPTRPPRTGPQVEATPDGRGRRDADGHADARADQGDRADRVFNGTPQDGLAGDVSATSSRPRAIPRATSRSDTAPREASRPDLGRDVRAAAPRRAASGVAESLGIDRRRSSSTTRRKRVIANSAEEVERGRRSSATTRHRISAWGRCRSSPGSRSWCWWAPTFAAFFVAQRLKSTPPVINVRKITQLLLAQRRREARRQRHLDRLKVADDATVDVVNLDGDRVRRLAENVPMQPDRPLRLVWDGKADGGARVPDGQYRLRVSLRDEGRSATSRRRRGWTRRPRRPQVCIGVHVHRTRERHGRTSISQGDREIKLYVQRRPRASRRSSGLSAPTRASRAGRDLRPPGQRTGACAGTGSWTASRWTAGVYLVQARVRDRAGNVGVTPAEFERRRRSPAAPA